MKQFNIGEIDTDAVIGAGGTTQRSVGILDSLSVSTGTLKNITVIVAEIFSDLSRTVGVKIDGILGYNFLSRFRIEINYHDKILCFKQ